MDTLTYEVCDNGSPVLCDTAEVIITITPVNDPPIADDEADTVIIATEEDFAALMAGDLNPMGAVMMGKVKIKGDMAVAMKLQSLMS